MATGDGTPSSSDGDAKVDFLMVPATCGNLHPFYNVWVIYKGFIGIKDYLLTRWCLKVKPPKFAGIRH